jgi:hypothetical protein
LICYPIVSAKIWIFLRPPPHKASGYGYPII